MLARDAHRGRASRRSWRRYAGSRLAHADAILEHRFDLLGSGPTDLGPEIDWHARLQVRPPLAARHDLLLRLTYRDGSDVKVPWELSRCQHLPLLAGAYRLTRRPAATWTSSARSSTSWIEANPVELGVNWASTMDVAIRAANWVAALASVAEDAAEEQWFANTLGSLLLHGRFIRSHLEWSEARGNHYLSNVVGLLPVAVALPQGPRGQGVGSLGVRRARFAKPSTRFAPTASSTRLRPPTTGSSPSSACAGRRRRERQPV